MDWDQIVRNISVSSNESQACRLIDGIHSTCWQSSGPQGKVCVVAPVECGESSPVSYSVVTKIWITQLHSVCSYSCAQSHTEL